MKVTNELKVTNAFINRFCYLEPLACVSIYLFIYFKLTPCLDSKIYVPQFHDDSSGMLRPFASC